ncbi:TPR_2 repeat domain protein [Psychroflexus torquis ATCC 700755]|uniref:TPR_2 repeat domain protein n=1 Tax=Psychroflexus torquis (strain ATCC 700755 / CIP 106069 / ACAM 623) TaxID=313595 RepID=K4ISZ6_PSYTT|nr:tetratricopeptide repeat protein [Psychroflexus torquis]AFU68590.1 TPR_2 repeat domain protein [Psychroflexus torquis ATCC 700755]
MKLLVTSLLTLSILSSCHSQNNKIDNTQPRYGEVKKTKEYRELDEEFIQDCLKQFGTIDSSAAIQIDHAWRYYYNNDLKTAMKRFNQSWLLNPELPDSYFGFASLLETQGNLIDAKRYYKIGIEKDTKNDRAELCYQRIADCKEQLNDIQGTLNAYKKITKIDPKNSFAFKKIGYFYTQSGHSNKAIKAYDDAIRLDPKDAMTYNNRAFLNQKLKNYEAAITDYSKAIELDPEYISSLVNRGLTEMEINQFEKAKSDFGQCVKLDPKAGELRRFLAISELKLNENSSACNNLKLALELGDSGASQLIEENCKK